VDERRKLVEVNLSEIKTNEDLHQLLKEKLEFPSFYGMNWNAFWDAISGLVEMPIMIRICGWSKVKVWLPTDTEILEELLEKLKEEYPSWSSQVEYID